MEEGLAGDRVDPAETGKICTVMFGRLAAWSAGPGCGGCRDRNAGQDVLGDIDPGDRTIRRGKRPHWPLAGYRREPADRHATEQWILDKACEIIVRSGYADSVISLPLGQVFGLDDEWGAGWGRTAQELRAEIREACAAQLATSRP